MIQLESLSRYRRIDVLAIIALAMTWSIFSYFINLANTTWSFMVFLLVTAIFACFTALLIRKLGAVLLFYLIGGFFTYPFSILGTGLNGLFILLVVGMVFELFLLVLKKEIKNIPLSLIIGAAISSVSIPWTMLLLISEKTKELVYFAGNFSLLALITGIMGAVICFLLWYQIKGTKAVIKFEYQA